MKRYYLAAAVLLALFVIVGSTQYAWATDLNVTQTDSCAGITVHIVSVWDGTTRVYVDDGTSPIHIDVAPHATRDVAVQWGTRTEVHVVVSAPAAHLHGAVDVTHTLPASCTPTTVPTTEAPPSTTTPTTAPTAPSTSAPTPPSVVDTTPIATTAPGPSSSGSAPSPSRPPSSTPASPTLPTTGSDPTFRALLGFGFGIVGLALMVTTRRRAT